MATEVIYTLDPGGGQQYTSFVTAVADLALIDWVALDLIPVIECYGTGNVAERVDISIATTDATHPLIIRPAAGNWGTGVLGAGFRNSFSDAYDGVFEIGAHVKMYGFEVENTSGFGRTFQKMAAGYGSLTLVGMLLKSRYGVEVDSGVIAVGCIHIARNIADAEGFHFNQNCYNCLSVDHDTGFESSNFASLYINSVNCVAWNCPLPWDTELESDANSYNNASPLFSTRGVPGANSLQQDVVSGDFTDTASQDFTLTSGSALRRIGADVSAILGDDWLDITGKPFSAMLPPIGPHQAPEASELQTVFTDQVPGTTGLADSDYELGMKFQADVDGEVHAIRFWKDAAESGVHTGRIWSSTGTELTSVVFTDESASGWQNQVLASPLAITAGTVYVVSVNAHLAYVATTAGLATSIVNGNISSVDDDLNGVFNETQGLFPTGSFNEGNYFRDIVFVADPISGITPDGVSHSHTVDAGVLSTSTGVNPLGLSHSHTVDAANLGVAAILAPIDINHSHTVDAGVLSTGSDLLPDGVNHSNTVDAGVLSTLSGVTPVNISHSHTVGTGGLSTSTGIVPIGISHAQTVDAGVINSGAFVLPDGMNHGHTVDAGSIGTTYDVTPIDISHGHAVGISGLGTGYQLTPEGLDHGHTVAASTLLTLGVVSPLGLSHGHSLDEAVLVLDYVDPTDVTHAHTLDAATIEGGVSLINISYVYNVNTSITTYLVD